jgi:hypothetical protein
MSRVIPTAILVLLTGGCVIPFEGWVDDADYVNVSRSEPAGDETSLRARVELKVGELQVGPGPTDKAFEVDLRYNEKGLQPRVDFSREDREARLAISLEGGNRSFRTLGKNLISVRMNPRVPLTLDANTGVGESSIDLSDMNVRSVLLQSGVGETRLSMARPNRGPCDRVEVASGVGAFQLVGLGNFGCREFRFRGGVGESKLELSGDWEQLGDIEVDVGVGGVQIVIPRNLAAEVRIAKGLFSDAQMPEFRKQGDTYISENADRVDKMVRINVRAGIGGVNFRWM